jgi:hypothetical protein
MARYIAAEVRKIPPEDVLESKVRIPGHAEHRSDPWRTVFRSMPNTIPGMAYTPNVRGSGS